MRYRDALAGGRRFLVDFVLRGGVHVLVVDVHHLPLVDDLPELQPGEGLELALRQQRVLRDVKAGELPQRDVQRRVRVHRPEHGRERQLEGQHARQRADRGRPRDPLQQRNLAEGQPDALVKNQPEEKPNQSVRICQCKKHAVGKNMPVQKTGSR
jgi:hypothetical protein